MKFIQHFDQHIVINLFGILIRIKQHRDFECPKVVEKGITDEKREMPIIVSLTSFPKRINTVIKAIKTLLTQTLKPDEVILWLAPEQFPNKENDLPKELLDLKEFGLTIDWYKDIRSYKKIIPTLNKYPEAIVITVDDDILYAKDTVETLYNSYLEHPNDIQAHRCDCLTFDNGVIGWERTKQLFKDKHRGTARFKNRLTGFGAVLYPPNCLYKDVLNEDLIKETIPTHDDVWLWAMAVLAGTKTRLVKGYSESVNYIQDSQQHGLCKINKAGIGVGLSEAYEIILKKYPQILSILEGE